MNKTQTLVILGFAGTAIVGGIYLRSPTPRPAPANVPAAESPSKEKSERPLLSTFEKNRTGKIGSDGHVGNTSVEQPEDAIQPLSKENLSLLEEKLSRIRLPKAEESYLKKLEKSGVPGAIVFGKYLAASRAGSELLPEETFALVGEYARQFKENASANEKIFDRITSDTPNDPALRDLRATAYELSDNTAVSTAGMNRAAWADLQQIAAGQNLVGSKSIAINAYRVAKNSIPAGDETSPAKLEVLRESLNRQDPKVGELLKLQEKTAP